MVKLVQSSTRFARLWIRHLRIGVRTMIYKFKFEVCDNDNDHVFYARSEESGSFWWSFTEFMRYIMNYAVESGLGRR